MRKENKHVLTGWLSSQPPNTKCVMCTLLLNEYFIWLGGTVRTDPNKETAIQREATLENGLLAVYPHQQTRRARAHTDNYSVHASIYTHTLIHWWIRRSSNWPNLRHLGNIRFTIALALLTRQKKSLPPPTHTHTSTRPSANRHDNALLQRTTRLDGTKTCM